MKKDIELLLKKALKEDMGGGDVTTNLLIDKNKKAKAVFLAKEEGVVSGLFLIEGIYRLLDKKIKVKLFVKDGGNIKKGTILAEVSGHARGILSGERLVLNFLQRMSGISSLTKKFVEATKGTKAKILDTRKTVPLLRALDKYAVFCGGGMNHRFGLYDAILIKDNHLALVPIKTAVLKAKKAGTPFEVEVKNLKELDIALSAGANRVLLDNMNLADMKKAVLKCAPLGVKTEASGGVNLKNVKQIALCGVDFISIGALTHSVRALDVSLELL